ncbi:MAG: cytochrome c [Thermoanaerobaculum sp.]|nr:MAG: cytochrome c [Thermoanaerobaculum sp.]
MARRFLGPWLVLAWFAGSTAWAQEDAASGDKVEQAVSQALEKARAAATALTQALMGELLKHMREGGPEAAVSVCSAKAQEITKAQQQEGVLVRRVTARPRNPQNRPDDYEQAMLALMEHRYRKDKTASEVADWYLEGEALTVRYLRPIVIGEMCLACHGDRQRMKPAVREFLTQHYPEDQAVGYQAGDFRGAVSVTVKTTLPPEPQKP